MTHDSTQAYGYNLEGDFVFTGLCRFGNVFFQIGGRLFSLAAAESVLEGDFVVSGLCHFGNVIFFSDRRETFQRVARPSPCPAPARRRAARRDARTHARRHRVRSAWMLRAAESVLEGDFVVTGESKIVSDTNRQFDFSLHPCSNSCSPPAGT